MISLVIVFLTKMNSKSKLASRQINAPGFSTVLYFVETGYGFQTATFSLRSLFLFENIFL
jgi:hypothetical protein